MSALLPSAVLVPVAFAVVCVVLPRRLQMVPGLVGAVVSGGLAVAIMLLVATNGVAEHHLAGWDAPLGIVLRADGLSAPFLGLAGVVVPAISVMAASERAATGVRAGYWPLSLLMTAGLMGVFLTGDLFNAYVSLEVLGLSAVGLVALGGGGSTAAAFRYLMVTVVGSMAVLLAVGFVYAATGTLDLVLISQRISPEHALLPLALTSLGLALKTALVPLHAWLPDAHAGAPAAVSPLLSALVIKGSFYLLLRLWLDVLPGSDALALALGLLGAVAIFGGGAQALRQRQLKRIAAYSTVVQVGYLFVAFPMLQDREVSVVSGVVAMAVAHGLAKAALFAAAGSLVLGTGGGGLDDLVGASRSQRMLTAGIMLAAISLTGLPLSLGFAAKWQYLVVAVEHGPRWIAAALILGTLLSAAYLLRPIAALLRDSDKTQEVGRADPKPRPIAQRWVALLLGLAAVLAGLAAGWLDELLMVGRGP